VIKLLSRILSYTFQPLVIPTLVFWLWIVYFPLFHVNGTYQYFLMIVSILFTSIFPAIMLLGLYRLKWISTLDIEDPRERFVPYLITLFFYGVQIWLMYVKDVHTLFLITTISMFVSIFIAMIITFFWKISTHMVALGGLVGLLIRLSINFYSFDIIVLLLVSILISGLVMSARVYLNKHTIMQVYIGFLLGILVSLISSYFIF
jgi:membrane-associated phospholipid phosphatase